MNSNIPNGHKFTTNSPYCLAPSGSNADLSHLYHPSNLHIEHIEREEDRSYHMFAHCNLTYGTCPYCGHVSQRIHSRYMRTIHDLSILGHPVFITFEARKFFCDNPLCHRKTFAEQPGDEVFRYR